MEVAKNMGFLTVMDDKALEYPSDGVVYRCDSWRQCEELGYTSKYPRFAVALKTREVVTATTILKDVLKYKDNYKILYLHAKGVTKNKYTKICSG